MQMITGRPLKGAMLQRLKAFLRLCGLDYDEAISFTVVLEEDDEIIASGSLDGGTLKCIAVSPMHQGEDLTARVLTELRREAFDRSQRHLMLFTKPGNQHLFAPFGFYPVMRTADCLLMEDQRNGLQRHLENIEKYEGSIGCIVANCNPFTNGHRYLIETAAAQVDHLHLFILSEGKGMFAPEVRLELARLGCADLKNVHVHASGPYMVSAATFPSYFIKDKTRVNGIHCELDIRLFGEKIAPALGISRRFVGTEPNCEVTRFYNEQMKLHLPGYGVEVIEIPRRLHENNAISASRVRALISEGRTGEIRPMVPETTYKYICEMQ